MRDEEHVFAFCCLGLGATLDPRQVPQTRNMNISICLIATQA